VIAPVSRLSDIKTYVVQLTEKIAASAADLQRVHSRLKAERDAAQRRADNAGAQLIEVSQTLEQDRIALDSFRRQTFETISQGGGTPSTDQPPSYGTTVSIISGQTLAATAAPPAEAHPTAGQAAPPSLPEPRTASLLLPVVPPNWGSRNPYAAALATQTPPSYDSVDERRS